MSKITKDELKELKEFKSKSDTLLRHLGILESQKHRFLHSLADLNNQQEEFNARIEEQYGKITVSLEDGSYEEIKEEE